MMKFRYMDPEMIMTMVISLIILAIGVYAFFVVMNQVQTTVETSSSLGFGSAAAHVINNTTGTGTSVFNIIGIVLIIGAIMTIVGLVYSYVRPGAY